MSADPRLGRPGGLRPIVSGVWGMTTADGDDRLVVAAPAAPDDDARRAAVRVARRSWAVVGPAAAVAREWAPADGARPAGPPLALRTVRAAAWIAAVLLAGDIVLGAPLPVLPLAIVAVVLAFVGVLLGAVGRVGVALHDVEAATREVDGPVLDVARAALEGDPDAVARLEALRDAWWAAPVDGEAADTGDPWRVRPLGDERLWATNDLGDAVYGPGVLGISRPGGRTELVAVPPDGLRGWRRLLLLQTTGATRRLQVADRTALWFAMAPPEARGARTAFVVGGLAGLLVAAAVGVAVGTAVDTHPVGWGIAAAVAFSTVTGGLEHLLSTRVANAVCRRTPHATPAQLELAEALLRAVDDRGADAPAARDAHRRLWQALADGVAGLPRR